MLAQPPTTLTGQGYSFEADIWGFGLSIIACALGAFPLAESTHGPDGGGYWGLVHAVCETPAPGLPDSFSPAFRAFVGRCVALPGLVALWPCLAGVAIAMSVPRVLRDPCAHHNHPPPQPIHPSIPKQRKNGSCLAKDPTQRASSKELLLHPFIASRHHLHKDARGRIAEVSALAFDRETD